MILVLLFTPQNKSNVMSVIKKKIQEALIQKVKSKILEAESTIENIESNLVSVGGHNSEVIHTEYYEAYKKKSENTEILNTITKDNTKLN